MAAARKTGSRAKTGRKTAAAAAPSPKETRRRSRKAADPHDVIAREIALLEAQRREALSLRAEHRQLAARLAEIDRRLTGLEIARQTLDREGYSPPVGRAPRQRRPSARGK